MTTKIKTLSTKKIILTTGEEIDRTTIPKCNKCDIACKNCTFSFINKKTNQKSNTIVHPLQTIKIQKQKNTIVKNKQNDTI
tara:strand:+ start:284 stop:526 length:243 start_codon:yes stop_codon:yes gene_type:complete